MLSFLFLFSQKRNLKGRSILHENANLNCAPILEALLKKTFDADNRNNHNESPLFIAVTYGQEGICKLLCDAGSDINEVCYGKSLLHTAIDMSHLKIAELLINRGADLDKQDNDGNIPLHLAAVKGSQHEKLVKSLIEKGDKEQLSRQNNKGNTPLHIAAKTGHFRVVQLLLDHQVPVEITNYDGDTPLHLSAQSGDATCVKMILDKDKSLVHWENSEGHLPLHKAIAGKCNLMCY